MVEKYGMTNWDEFAKENESIVDELRRIVESYN